MSSYKGGGGGNEPEDFIVEKILDKKVDRRTGQVQYFLKWKGFPDADNTWEPAGNLNCQELIAAFEKKWERQQVKEKDASESRTANGSGGGSSSSAQSSGKKMQKRSRSPDLEPDKIIGATDASGTLMFLMKWKNTDDADLIPASEANVKYPQVVIKFYERRLTWKQQPMGSPSVAAGVSVTPISTTGQNGQSSDRENVSP